VNPIQLLGIIQNAQNLNKDDVNELYKLHETFAYFQIPKVLLAKHEFNKSAPTENKNLPWAAVTSPDRAWLKKLIETNLLSEKKSQVLSQRLRESIEKKNSENGKNFIDDLEGHLIPETIKVSTPKDLTATLKKLGEDLAQSKLKAFEKLDGLSNKTEIKNDAIEISKPVFIDQDDKEIEKENISNTQTEKISQAVPVSAKKRKPYKDELIESIKRKEKKEILDKKKLEQIDIIKAFSKKEIKLATLKEIEVIQEQDDLSEKSTKINPFLLTESYARILTKQGKKGRAKEIYEELMVKFPKKNTYFANLINELEENKD
jgi:hypothetical protein